LRWDIRRVCRRLGFDRPIIWSFLPTTADVVGALDEKLVVYGCVDDYSEFGGGDKDAIQDMENRLVRNADAVIVTSGPLLASRRALNPDTYLVEHGVDVEHFRLACSDETPRAASISSLPGPVIGFIGLIAEWVDAGLIRYVARHRPDASIVLVGKEDVDTSELRRLPNVHFTGQVPYESLPSYCKCFDVAMVPFVINQLTLASNPLKMKEYLAAGLPVVSTNLPEAARLASRTGFLRVGLGFEHFVEQIDRFLNEGVAGPQMRISETMAGESWDAKVEQMSAIVHEAMEEMMEIHRPARDPRERLLATKAFR
jgi:glycosyltransferase involved in cell wall biosynthesis